MGFGRSGLFCSRYGERLDKLSETDESPFEYLYRHEDKDTNKASLKEKLLDYAIAQKIQNKYRNALEDHPKIQSFLKILSSPFLAKALFALIEKGVNGEDILTEKDKYALLLEIFTGRDIKHFLLVIIQIPDLAREIFPLFIKGGFIVEKSFNAEDVAILTKCLKTCYNMPQPLINAYRESLLDTEDKVSSSISLWMVPFIDRKLFAKIKREDDAKYYECPLKFTLAKTFILQDLPSWAMIPVFFDNLIHMFAMEDFPFVVSAIAKSPEKFKIFSKAIRLIQITEDSRANISFYFMNFYMGLLNDPWALFSQSWKVATLTDLMPVIMDYSDHNNEKHPFSVFALLHLDIEACKDFLNNISDYYDILTYVLNNPKLLSRLPAEIVNILINKLSEDELKKLFLSTRFLSVISIPDNFSMQDILNTPSAFSLLKLLPSLLLGLDPAQITHTLKTDYDLLISQNEKWMLDPEGYLLFVFTRLMSLQESLAMQETKYTILDTLSDEQCLPFSPSCFITLPGPRLSITRCANYSTWKPKTGEERRIRGRSLPKKSL